MVVVTGGFVTTATGLRISARSPLPAVLVSGLSALLWVALARRAGAMAADLAAVDEQLTRHARWLVASIAVTAAVAAAAFHSYSATGADASGYLSFAKLLSQGSFTYEEPLAALATWTDGPSTLAPLGWRPALEPGRQVPTYAIGLPLLLVPLHLVGGAAAASLIIPLSLLVAVAATGAIAYRAAGAVAAVIGALWLATSPVALIESMQVMSDVPVTAAWLVCWWSVFAGRPGAAGVAAAFAILIRPNLAPLAIVPFLAVLVRHRHRAALGFAVPVVVAGSVVAALQSYYFGSPLRSGYGTAAEIYALSNVLPNAALYTGWLIDTHGPWLLAAPLVFLARTQPLQRGRETFDDGAATLPAHQWLWLAAFALLVVVAYLIYAQFETWTYLRFMLPAMAVAAVACATVLTRLLAALRPALRVPLIVVLLLGIAATNVSSARAHGVFRFAGLQARARSVGERLAATLPARAAIVSAEQSGAMRYYTGRSIIRWDFIDAAGMAAALERLTLEDYEVWVVLDAWEEEAFRKRLPALAAASIDYAPAVESAAGVPIRTRAWRARTLTARSSNNE